MKTADEIRRQVGDRRLEKIEFEILQEAHNGKYSLTLSFDHYPCYLIDKLKEKGFYTSEVKDLTTSSQSLYVFEIQW